MTKDQERDQFIKVLTSSSPTELKDFIDSKGKTRKLVCPVVFHKKSVEEQSE